MTEYQIDRALSVLERIADALEYANSLQEYEMGGEEPSDNNVTSLD